MLFYLISNRYIVHLVIKKINLEKHFRLDLFDDVRYIDRGEETSPPYKNINLHNGQKLRKDWFPVVWSN